MARDLAAFGVSEEAITQWIGGRMAPQPFEVLPDNEQAVTLFLRAENQWRVGGMDGVVLGLDYAGVAAAARAVGMRLKGELFESLQVMESAALAALHKRRRR